MAEDDDTDALGEYPVEPEHILLVNRADKIGRLEERRQSAYLWMEIVRFSIAGILTLAAIVVGMVIFFWAEDANAKTWALSLMQAAFFAGIGYSFGSHTSISTALGRSSEGTNTD